MNPIGDSTGHNDTLIGSRCPGGRDHGGDAGNQVNSPVESSPISVAPPFGMFFFLILVCQCGCITLSVLNICVL